MSANTINTGDAAHILGPAHRATDQFALALIVEIIGVLKPSLKAMVSLANYIKNYHGRC